MKRIEKKVDFNAHVAEVQTELFREDGKSYVKIGLKNVSEKILERVIFTAIGFDYFGDVIKTEGKDSFDIILEQLNLKPGEIREGYLTEINEGIRNLELTEYSALFADGAEEIYPGPEYHIYYTDCFMTDSYKDKPQLDILKEKDERFCCYPKEKEEGWICACGYLNWSRREVCGGCGHGKKEIFALCNKEAVAEAIKEKREAFDERMRCMAEQRKRQDRIETVKFILQMILIGGVILAAFYVLWRFRLLK